LMEARTAKRSVRKSRSTYGTGEPRRDTLASAGVLRRLEAIERALTQKRLNVSDANRALKQAVGKIVMDTECGTLTFHWHHADEPSDPIHFAWVPTMNKEHQRTPNANGERPDQCPVRPPALQTQGDIPTKTRCDLRGEYLSTKTTRHCLLGLRLFGPDAIINQAAVARDRVDRWPEDTSRKCHVQHLAEAPLRTGNQESPQ
jgi:hypothetical protein